MSQAHKDAAKKRAAKYPKGHFSVIARKRQAALSVDERRANAKIMVKGKKAKAKSVEK